MTNKEAIERLEYIKTHHTDPEDYELFDFAIKVLEERPQGEWHWNEQGYFYCNKCNRQPRDQYAVTNFCPNCGASMKPKANQLRDCENCIHHSDNGCEVWECEFEKRSGL